MGDESKSADTETAVENLGSTKPLIPKRKKHKKSNKGTRVKKEGSIHDKSKYTKKYEKHTNKIFNMTLESVAEDFGIDGDLNRKLTKKRKRESDATTIPVKRKRLNSAYKEFVTETSKLVDEYVNISPRKLLHLSKSHKIVNGVVIAPVESFYRRHSEGTDRHTKQISLDKSLTNSIKPSALSSNSKATKKLETLFSAMENNVNKAIIISEESSSNDDTSPSDKKINTRTEKSAPSGDKKLRKDKEIVKVTDIHSDVQNSEKVGHKQSDRATEGTNSLTKRNDCDSPDISGIAPICLEPPPSPVLNLTEHSAFFDSESLDVISIHSSESESSLDLGSNNPVPDLLVDLKSGNATGEHVSAEPSLTITNVWSMFKKNTILAKKVNPTTKLSYKSPEREPVKSLRLIDSLKKKPKTKNGIFKRESSSSTLTYSGVDLDKIQFVAAENSLDKSSESLINVSEIPLGAKTVKPVKIPTVRHVGGNRRKHVGEKKMSKVVSRIDKLQKKNWQKGLKLRIKLNHKDAAAKNKIPKMSNNPQVEPQLDLVPTPVKKHETKVLDTTDMVNVVNMGMESGNTVLPSCQANSNIDVIPVPEDEPSHPPNEIVLMLPVNKIAEVAPQESVSADIAQTQYSVSLKPSSAVTKTIDGQSDGNLTSKNQNEQISDVIMPKCLRNENLPLLEPIVILSDVLPTLTFDQKHQLQGKTNNTTSSDDQPRSVSETTKIREENKSQQTKNHIRVPSAKKKLRPRPAPQMKKQLGKRSRIGQNSDAANVERKYRSLRFVHVKKLQDYNEIIITVESVLEKKQDTNLRREYNFLTAAALRDLINAFNICKGRRHCKAVLLSSVGPIFSSGLNPVNLVNWTPATEATCNIVSLMEKLVDVLIHFDKPIIGAVQGPAVGFGASLLLFCDSVYASTRSHFQWPGSQMGLPAFGCVTSLLPKAVGSHRARSLLLQCNLYTAAEAKASGLVTDIFPHDSFMRHAVTACENMCVSNSAALQLTKHSIMSPDREHLRKCNTREAASLQQCLKSKETQTQLQTYILTQLLMC